MHVAHITKVARHKNYVNVRLKNVPLVSNSKLFFGNGTSPNTYLSSKKGFKYKGIPFLEYSSDGSYIGMDIDIPSEKSMLFSFSTRLLRAYFAAFSA